MDLTVVAVAILLGLLGIGLVNSQWRSGVFIILGVGFLQDAFRKLAPGQPIGITAAVAVVMLIVWGIGLNQFGGYREQMSLRRHYPELGKALTFFIGLVLFQSLVTMVSFGSVQVAVVGLLAYLSPLPAIWIGWWVARTSGNIHRWFLLYIVFGIVVASGVYLSWMGADWAVLKQIGNPLIVYHPILGAVETHSGFMRVAEIAAWHLGAAACFAIVLATTRPSLVRILLFALAISFMAPAIFLTGRRKALAMIGLFIGLLVILLHFSRNMDARKATLGLVGLALGTVSVLFYLSEDASDVSAFRPYIQRGESVTGDALDRFFELGLESPITAIAYTGLFGWGAGVFSQGSQSLNIELPPGAAAEGGLGKIIMELGIPGLLILIWIFWAALKVLRNQMRTVADDGSATTTISLSLIAFLMVNVITFITASQVFGDPFVLIIIGMIFGMALGISRRVVPRPPVGYRAPPYNSAGSPARARYKV